MTTALSNTGLTPPLTRTTRRVREGAGALAEAAAATLVRALAPRIRRAVVKEVIARDPMVTLEVLGPQINRSRTLDTMVFDLPVDRPIRFENLVGLFASTSLDHAVIAMTVRQTAYLYGLVRGMPARKVLEVGRYKGGSTLTIASAMDGEGEFWSIDIGEKELRLRADGQRSYDEQLRDVLERFGLSARLLVGNSREIEVETGELDLVFIDGDHSYEGAKSDFERFGRRVRIGGAVLFDDSFDEKLFTTHSDTVGRLVEEIGAGQEFQLVKGVDRLAHLTRVA